MASNNNNNNNPPFSQPRKIQDFDNFSSTFGCYDKVKHQSHFALQPPQVITNAVRSLLETKGDGAEQDAYGNHFNLSKSPLGQTKDLLSTKGSGAEQDAYGRHFGVGQDGIKKMKEVLSAKGDGAEQDTYNQHFGLGQEGVEKMKKALDVSGVGAQEASVPSLSPSSLDVRRWDC